MWEVECGEGGELHLERHETGHRTGVLSGPARSQCQVAGGGAVGQESSGAFGKPLVKWQVEMWMKRVQHQQVRTDSDHHSVHIPLQEKKERLIS